MREDRFLGEVLVRHGLLSPERLEQLFELQREKGSDLIGLLVSGNIVDEVSLHRALADEAGLPFVEKIDVEAIPTALATQLPITYAKAHRIIPIDETDSQITILCADPFSTATIDDVRALLSKRVDLKVATAEGIVDAINRVYEREVGHASDLKTESGEDADDDEIVDILDSDDDAPIIRWVRSLYRQAVKERASDIHIEPEEREVIVRYRIDGKLYVAKKAPRQFMN